MAAARWALAEAAPARFEREAIAVLS